MKAKHTIQAYIIEEIATPSPNLVGLVKYCNSSEGFVQVLASRVHPKKDGYVEVIGIENLDQIKFDYHKDISSRLRASLAVLKSIALLHEKQFTLGQNCIEDMVAYSHTSHLFQLKAYKCTNKQDFKVVVPIANKIMELAKKYGIQCFFVGKESTLNPFFADIWKWGYFTLQLLYHGSLPKKLTDFFDKILALQSLKKQQQNKYIPVITKTAELSDLQEVSLDHFLAILRSCLSPLPECRPTTIEIITSLHNLIKVTRQASEHLTEHQTDYLKKDFHRKKSQIRPEFEIQIPADQTLILTAELKKKINPLIHKITTKQVKDYKPLFRATRFNFDPTFFYSQCTGFANLLFCIDTVENGVILAHIAPQITLIEDRGLFGGYLSDENLHSFIYSLRNQQVYRLVDKTKAFKSCPACGPIIGDDDIILSNHPKGNQSLFPKSYEKSSKKKQLIGSQKNPESYFAIKNYDVYQILFKK